MKKIVELSGVNKSFNSLKVIENLNIFISQNEVVSLVGPSGCGKTTILRIISGLEKSDGTVKRKFTKPAFIFQEHRLLPWKTARDNVNFVLFDRVAKQDERNKIAKKYLHLMAIDKFADYYPSQLSEGMKKRIAIARALAIDPDLILMDEPFSDLDFPLRLLLIDLFKEILRKESKTVIYVTHDIREALLFSHRLYVLTRKPMKVKEELHIKEKVRQYGIDNPEFVKLERHVIEFLKEENIKEFISEE
jgi:ABC-type nitrate/sulfonate/bicarbonate transport system ATPase subunit